MIDLLVTILRSGTPLIFAAMAGMLAQRSGVWHLGLEGLMIIGACGSVLGTMASGSVWIGLLIAIGLCLATSLLFWFVIEVLRASPIIAGLGLTGLGLGGTDLAVQVMFGTQGSVRAPVGLPHIEGLGGFSELSVLVFAMPVVVFALFLLTRRTRFGLQLAACGEHPFAARSVGVNPARMRLIALLLGGVLCALAGAELALGSLQIFSINMTAGRGFMAFSAVIFGAGHPIGSTAAALFFALIDALGVRAQLAFGDAVPHHFLLMLPYIATVAGIWLSIRLRGGARAASGLGELRDG